MDTTPICIFDFCFTKEAIKYFKTLPTSGFTKNKNKNKNGNITQKEIAGVLKVKNTEKSPFELDIDSKSIIIGKEEGVDIAPGLYNFHSHPKEAYKKHKVHLAWPSNQDYVGFMLAVAEDHTICHAVITIEGIYIISLTLDWFNNPLKLDKKFGNFIMKKYDISCGKVKTIDEYLSICGNIKYNNTGPLIDVQYLSWNNPYKPFNIIFGKRKSKCLIK